jgi:hypothetical protein
VQVIDHKAHAITLGENLQIVPIVLLAGLLGRSAVHRQVSSNVRRLDRFLLYDDALGLIDEISSGLTPRRAVDVPMAEEFAAIDFEFRVRTELGQRDPASQRGEPGKRGTWAAA